MNADDIFFENNGEKKLIETTGYTSKPCIKFKKNTNLENLRLVNSDSKNALPLRLKINNEIFALGSFPDGIVIKSLLHIPSTSLSDYNISYVYDLTGNSLKLISTIDFGVHNGGYFKEQNFYIVGGFKEVKSGGAYTFVNWYAISLDGYNWNSNVFLKIIRSISYKGRVAFLVEEYKEDYPYSVASDNVYATIYTVEDGEFVMLETFSPSYTDMLKTFDFSGNIYTHDISGTIYYKLQPKSTAEDKRFVYSFEKTRIEIEDIPSYPDIWTKILTSKESSYHSSYYSRILGETFDVSIDKDKKISITDSNGTEVNSVIADGPKNEGYLDITVLSVKEFASLVISAGTYTNGKLFSLLSDYIAENSYRVLGSSCTISDGTFTITMSAGQRIWLCSQGDSPNYAKVIWFVDDKNDWSGRVPQFYTDYTNYNFYSYDDGETGWACVDKRTGRYGTYMDVSSYNVTITGGISFI